MGRRPPSRVLGGTSVRNGLNARWERWARPRCAADCAPSRCSGWLAISARSTQTRGIAATTQVSGSPPSSPRFAQCREPLTMISFCLDAQRLHVAAESRAPQLLPEICQSTAAHIADCGLDSAAEDSQSCTGRPPRKARHGRARGSAARCIAARPARHSCTACHL